MAKLANKFPVKTGPECNWCYGSDREKKFVLMANVAKARHIVIGVCVYRILWHKEIRSVI